MQDTIGLCAIKPSQHVFWLNSPNNVMNRNLHFILNVGFDKTKPEVGHIIHDAFAMFCSFIRFCCPDMYTRL